jgi:hypothetical protein
MTQDRQNQILSQLAASAREFSKGFEMASRIDRPLTEDERIALLEAGCELLSEATEFYGASRASEVTPSWKL